MISHLANAYHHNYIALDSERDPAFRTINVPVQPGNRGLPTKVAPTHRFNPLCATMRTNHHVLRPAEYSTVLPGAIAQVTFTLSHKLLKRPGNSTSHFTATINEIEVLERPARISLSPAKANNQAMFRKRGPEDKNGASSSKQGANNDNVASSSKRSATDDGGSSRPKRNRTA